MASIVLRHLKRGPRYYIRYYVAGRPYWFSVGTTRRLAELAKAKTELRIAENRILDRQDRSRWTMAQLAASYLPRMAELRPRSDSWRRSRMDQLLRALGAETPIESVSLETLDRYVEKRRGEGRAVSTVRAEIAVLRHSLRQAFRWRAETGMSGYRLSEWRPPKDDAAREPVFLGRTEVSRLIAAGRQTARTGRAAREGYAALLIALDCGARVSEIANIRWGDLDHRIRSVRLRTLKGGIPRSATLHASTWAALFRLRGKAGPADAALPGEAGAPSKERYRRFWEATRTAARLEHVRFQDLRHTFASEYLRRGGRMRDLQRLLGHTTARMTERYSHFSKDEKPLKGVDWSGTGSGTGRKRPEAARSR